MLDRIKVDKPNTTAYLKEIKRQYPLVFEMAIHASDVISKTTGKPLVEDEISYLALHFGTAYERHINTQKYRVVMIIPHNQMLAKACMDKIETRFRERMEIIKVFPFFENNMISSLHPDLILTVVPLQHELSIKTVSISLFVNYEDESQIFQALNQLDREKYHDQFCHIVKKLIGQETFFIKKDIASKEDAINYLCDNLIQLGYATQEYKEDVFNLKVKYYFDMSNIEKRASAIYKYDICRGSYGYCDPLMPPGIRFRDNITTVSRSKILQWLSYS